MYLESDIPKPTNDLNNYLSTSKLFFSKGELFYHVKSRKRNGEDKTKVKLYWNDEKSRWFANIEGNYSYYNNKGFFMRGPNDLNVEASRRLCDYFGLPWPWHKDHIFRDIISIISPEKFKEMSIEYEIMSKLEKASKK